MKGIARLWGYLAMGIFLALFQNATAQIQGLEDLVENKCQLPITDMSIKLADYPGGSLQLLAKVENNSTSDITINKIVGEFYSSAGEFLALENAYPEFSLISPGEYSPFKMAAALGTDNKTIPFDRLVLSCA